MPDTPQHLPLLVTTDQVLLDDLLRLAAAADVQPWVASNPAAAREQWAEASLVIVGDDMSEPLAAADLPRRDGVLLVGLDLDDATVWRRGLALGAGDVLFLPDAEYRLIERIADSAEGRPSDAPVLAVLGGRGGAGASTLATAFAVTAARQGRQTLLLDADPLGGGIDLLLGCEDSPGARWPDLTASSGRVSGSALREALPRPGGLTVLAWDRGDVTTIPVDSMRSVLAAARRSHDLVVLDIPRHLDPAATEALGRATVSLLVVPAEVRAAAAAARVCQRARMIASDIRAVVRGPAPADLTADTVADSLRLPLAGYLRPEPGLAAALERGDPPGRRRGPLADFCTEFLAGFADRAGQESR